MAEGGASIPDNPSETDVTSDVSEADVTSDPSETSINIDPRLTECPICLEQLRHPKSLPCIHIFCEECHQAVRAVWLVFSLSDM